MKKAIIATIVLIFSGISVFWMFLTSASYYSVLRIAEKNNDFVNMPIKDVLSMIQQNEYEKYPINSSYYIDNIEPIVSKPEDLSDSNEVCVITWNTRDRGGKYIFYLSNDDIVQRFIPVILWD